jgi:hypothetical protein
MYSEQVEKASKSINERTEKYIFGLTGRLQKGDSTLKVSFFVEGNNHMQHSALHQQKSPLHSYCLIFRDNDSKIVICVSRPKSAPFSTESAFSGRGAAEA